MGFLTDNCIFSIFSKDILNHSTPIECGLKDLDNFFMQDAFLQEQALLCKNYCFILSDDSKKVVATFTLSNDSIKKIPNARKKKVEKNMKAKEKQRGSIDFSKQIAEAKKILAKAKLQN